MNFLSQGFQKLEHEQFRHTHRRRQTWSNALPCAIVGGKKSSGVGNNINYVCPQLRDVAFGARNRGACEIFQLQDRHTVFPACCGHPDISTLSFTFTACQFYILQYICVSIHQQHESTKKPKNLINDPDKCNWTGKQVCKNWTAHESTMHVLCWFNMLLEICITLSHNDIDGNLHAVRKRKKAQHKVTI